MIQFKDVSTRHCLRGIQASFDEGECVVVCGPSGAGKSTLLRALAGLEPLAAGEIWWDGELASNTLRCLLPPHQRQIGMVFQDLGLWPHLNVRDNVALGVSRSRPTTKSKSQMIQDTMAECQLQNYGRRTLGSLAGGELCRVALARALVSVPRYLLLDEPFTGLDVMLKDSFLSLLAEVQASRAMTTIAVIHDPGDAWLMKPGRLLFMDDGELKESLRVGNVSRSVPESHPFLARWLGDRAEWFSTES